MNVCKRVAVFLFLPRDAMLARYMLSSWLRSFSRDEITPVRHEMTWTSLISSGVKERRKQFWPVNIGVAIADT